MEKNINSCAAHEVPASSLRRAGDFWLFLGGQTLSNLGSSFTFFALPLLVFKLTHSALNLGLTLVSSYLPVLLFGLVIGAWMDRRDRKRLMIVTDLVRALVIATIPLMARLNLLSVWWIYGASFTQTTLAIFFNSGQFAVLPSLVKQDDLVKANGRIEASYAGASAVGPLLAGMLVFVMPLPSLMLVDALSFLISACSLMLIKTRFNTDANQREKKSILQDISEGLHYVWQHPVLRNISIMMMLVNFVGTTLLAQLALFAKGPLQASDTQVGLLYSAASLGVVVLSLTVGQLRKLWSFSTVALGGLMLQGLLIIIFAFTTWYWVAVPLWALIQGLGTLFNINTASLRQAIVPGQMLGRVVTVAIVAAGSAVPAGALLGGLLIERMNNVVAVYAGIGVVFLLVPLIFSFTALGHAERYLPSAQGEPAERALP